MSPRKNKHCKKSGNVDDNCLSLLGYTRERFERERDERISMWENLKAKMEDPDVAPDEKHHLQCEFALQYGISQNTNPTAFIFCQTCWLKPHHCVCARWARFRPATRVIVYMHHYEWSRGSNTGVVLRASLEGCEIFVKGHREHDRKLQGIMDDPQYFVAVLWPCDGAINPRQLRSQMENEPTDTGKRLVVIVVDATWKQSNNMAHRFPSCIQRVALSPNAKMFPDGCATSLLFPIRAYGGSFEDSGRVSTLEAVAAFLRECGDSEEMCDGLLQNLKIKVDAMLRQKGQPTVYGT